MKGQKLQGEMYRSLQGRRRWVYRLNDKFNMVWTPKGMRPISVESPADLLLLSRSTNVLMECKEEKGKSISFQRLKSHQLQSLLEFEWCNPKDNHSFVVVQFTSERYVCIAIPIRDWLREEFLAKKQRKSLHFSRAQEIGIPLERIKGSLWNTKPLTAPTASISYTWKAFFRAMNTTFFLRRRTFRIL